MADGYARACGRPAACFIISGPGMTNITTAMGQAYADSIPMLVISSVNSSHELGLGEGRLHELPDQSALVAGVSAFSHRLLRPAELPSVIARAFAVFDGARPRPVHIELPLDVITAPADELSRTAHRLRSRPGARPRGDRPGGRPAARRPQPVRRAGRRMRPRRRCGPSARRASGCGDRGHDQRERRPAAGAPAVGRQQPAPEAGAGCAALGRRGARDRHRAGRDRHAAVLRPT